MKTTPEIRRRIFHLWCEGNRQREAGTNLRPPTMAELGAPYGISRAAVSYFIRSFSSEAGNRRAVGRRRAACNCAEPSECKVCRRRASYRASWRRRFYAQRGEPMPPVPYTGPVHLIESWNDSQPQPMCGAKPNLETFADRTTERTATTCAECLQIARRKR